MTQSLIGLLTGRVGIGKTTVAERVVGLARQRGVTCVGLLSPALVDSFGQKVGIWGIDVVTGERRVLARTDRELEGPTVGPYSFDPAALAWAVNVIESAIQRSAGPLPGPGLEEWPPGQILMVDEIGKLELWHEIGLAPVLPRLASGEFKRALVLVRDSLLSELDRRLGCVERVVFWVNEANRASVHEEILDRLLADSLVTS